MCERLDGHGQGRARGDIQGSDFGRGNDYFGGVDIFFIFLKLLSALYLHWKKTINK